MRKATKGEIKSMSGSWYNIPPHLVSNVKITQDIFPEDIEDLDTENIRHLIEEYFERTYPEFEPEIVYSMDSGERKDFYLPALKVLKYIDGQFFSPSRESKWKDMELFAECKAGLEYPSYVIGAYPIDPHNAPHENCNCGIYGSVNMNEIKEYVYSMETRSSFYFQRSNLSYESYDFTGHPVVASPKNVLCVIEPFPDAKTIITRKGWKTSHAFISEIVGETISVDSASQLLSIAWKRIIDVRRAI